MQKDPDLNGGTRMITPRDMEQIKRRSAYQESRDYTEREDTMRLRSEAEEVYEDEGEGEDDDEYDYNPRMEHVTTFLALAGGVVICVIVIILAINVFGTQGEEDNPDNQSSQSATLEPPFVTGDDAKYVKMPVVSGKSVEEARNELIRYGLKSEVAYEESETVAVGVVIRANVAAGADVPEGSTVILTASKGVEVPEVLNLTYAEAYEKLTALGFAVTKETAYSADVGKDRVMAQIPSAETRVARGTNITITICLGKERVRVPKLLGLSEQDATITAIEAGLEIGEVSQVYSSEFEEGQICYQSYSEGSFVEPGISVDIKVSKGVQNVTYRCAASITAPTVEEAPDYVTGTEVEITLVADNGQVLLETKTSSFPQAANYYGITSPGGTITITYSVKTGGTTTRDPVTGEVIAIPGGTEKRSFTRRVDFIAE